MALFVFNMVPIPPLDGSRVLYAFAPEALRDLMDRVEPFGFYLIFGLILLGGTAVSNVLSNFNNFILNLLP